MSKQFSRNTLLTSEVTVFENTLVDLEERLALIKEDLSPNNLKQVVREIGATEAMASTLRSKIETSYKANWIDTMEYEDLCSSMNILLDKAKIRFVLLRLRLEIRLKDRLPEEEYNLIMEEIDKIDRMMDTKLDGALEEAIQQEIEPQNY